MSVATTHDFSDRLSSMLVKEFRQGMRARSFVLPFVLFQLLATGTLVLEHLDSGYTSGSPFWLLVGAVMLILTPFSPTITLRDEINGRHHELLFTAGLSRWQVIRGKWLTRCSLSALLLISILPCFLVRYFMGGINIPANIGGLAFLIIANAVLHAIALGTSGYRNIIGRLMMLGFTCGSAAITHGIVIAATASSASDSLTALIFTILNCLVTATLYVLIGLQIGRAKLLLWENPVDPPATGLACALCIGAPLIVGAFAAGIPYCGGAIGSGIFILFAATIGADPKDKPATRSR